MPRNRPQRLRALPPSVPPSTTRGLPTRTAESLDWLDDPALTSKDVALELDEWRHVVSLPEAVLSAPHNDWAEFVGPSARAALDDAVRALGRREGAPLRAELARLDERFRRKTSNNPFADPALPWWARRWWH
ncbi:hypothetical protein [Microlunatus antarcticus]|uniref:Uncharacterized protein n=1 Tax=Microlunatus antarcticus TaxID=53388 RepID=A0A7W5P5U9_9ACTN|nr:hypothetical protein [Microlunatus antarcticus]MBB3325687.1 hypothetical protein [Microlunatus antarcticus]